eukprot:3802075-Prymnesium_polylepis.1
MAAAPAEAGHPRAVWCRGGGCRLPMPPISPRQSSSNVSLPAAGGSRRSASVRVPNCTPSADAAR